MIGRRTAKMAELRRIFESMGFSGVSTVLASGNVVFASRRSNVPALARSIERELKRALGYPVGVLVRSFDELEAIGATDPFRGIPRGPRTKLLITLLSKAPAGDLQTPYTSAEEDFTVLRVTDGTVFSVVRLAEGRRSSGIMSFLERRFGTAQTTRSWNTIQKVLAARKEGS
jgi:uncharacterized protein (DUF1697 family)